MPPLSATSVASVWISSAVRRVRAVRTMADELVRLGVLGGFQRIRQFGGRLRAAADRFDVVTMESLLRQLPAYVADIGEDNGVVE